MYPLGFLPGSAPISEISISASLILYPFVSGEDVVVCTITRGESKPELSSTAFR